MSKQEIYAAYDAILAFEASGNYRKAGRLIRSINKAVSRRTRK